MLVDNDTDECDHDWEFKDESYDHEFGCEQVHFYECCKCEEIKECD